jgi:GGDEF domain-containing protein
VLGDLEACGSTPAKVCGRLKANLLVRHLPIVVVTQRAGVSDRVAAMKGGADDCLVEPYEEAELFARIDRAIVRSQGWLDANPLTRLPGNAAIKGEIAARLARGEVFAVIFADLDNFKAFNDRYGFDRGDAALRVLGNIVLDALCQAGNGYSRDFAGHIGGDDFVVITTADRAEPLAERICDLVARRLPLLCDEEDRRAGYITGVDRQGRSQRFPLVTVSLAIVTNEERPFLHHSEFSQIGTEIKCYLKQHSGNRYLRNRRRASLPVSQVSAAGGGPVEDLYARAAP